MTSLKKSTLACAFTATLLVPVTSAQAASDSATVNITASVVDNTCTPQWNAGGVDVAMNRVSLLDFGEDKVAATKNFTLSLANCGAGATTVKVHAVGTSDSVDSTLFNNTAPSGATGVGIGLWGGETQATQLNPDGSNSVEYTIADSKVDMVFLAKLMKSGDATPSVGEVKSTVTMMVDYQ